MMKRRVSAVLVLLFLIAPAGAQVEIVHDPISYANALLMLSQLVRSYEQLRIEYDLMARNSKIVPVDMLSRYRSLEAAWYGLQLQSDRFGNLGGWLQTVNHGGSAAGGYNQASVALRDFGGQVSGLAADEQQRVASGYASVELTDGTNIQSMETVGALRANASTVDRAIQSLEADSLSLDPAMNTEIGVLNKINAATVAGLRSARDTNRALLSALEQQVAESKARRDAQVSDINTQIARLERGAAVKAGYTSTITDSIQSFRWR